MIKSLKLLELEEPDLYRATIKRLNTHPAKPDFVRYTWSEIVQLAQNQNTYLMRHGDSRWFQYRSQFTAKELFLMEQILCRDLNNEESLAPVKRQHASLVEKTTRYVQDIKQDIEATERLRSQYESLISNRGKIGMGDIESDMKKRFSD